MRVFLDVEDLTDIGALEHYIKQSAVILVLLSKGYFGSRNCLREARAAAASDKPLTLVHEADLRCEPQEAVGRCIWVDRDV